MRWLIPRSSPQVAKQVLPGGFVYVDHGCHVKSGLGTLSDCPGKMLRARVCFHCVSHASLGGLVLLAHPVWVGDGEDSGAVCLEV